MQPDKVREQGAIRDPASNYAFFLEFFSPHLILSADQQNHTKQLSLKRNLASKPKRTNRDRWTLLQ